MFSAQAVARSEENRAKQVATKIGRMGLNLLTKGVSQAGFSAADAAKSAAEKPKINDGVVI